MKRALFLCLATVLIGCSGSKPTAEERPATEPTPATQPQPTQPTQRQGTTEPKETLYQGKPLGFWVAQLQDKDAALRREAVKVLATIGPEAKSAVPALAELRKDDDEGVRQAVREALPKIDSQAAKTLLAAKVGFLPVMTGTSYFNACKRGAEEAAKEVGVELEYDGPSLPDAKKQVDLLNRWVTSGDYQCVIVAIEEPAVLAPALVEARKKGILIVTLNSDLEDARDSFVSPPPGNEQIQAVVEVLANQLEPKGTGKVGVLTGNAEHSLAKPVQDYAKEKYPKLELLSPVEHGYDRARALEKAKDLLAANPDLKALLGVDSISVAAAGEAVRQQGKKGTIKVGGLAFPSDVRESIKDGTVQYAVCWNPVDVGYLSVRVADLLRKKQLPHDGDIDAGRLGKVHVLGGMAALGKALICTRDNLDACDF